MTNTLRNNLSNPAAEATVAWQPDATAAGPFSLLVAAQLYAERGWYVFPLADEGKSPLTSNGVLDATTDQDVIRQWWTQWPTAGIGIACRKSGFLAIDEDGEAGASQLAALLAKHPDDPIPLTNVQRSGTRGGRHILVADPSPGDDGWTRVQADGGACRGNLKHAGAPNVDIKCNGYIKAEPSGAYEWTALDVGDDGRVRLAAAPQWLLDLIRKPEDEINLNDATVDIWMTTVRPLTSDEVTRMRAELAALGKRGNGNNVTFRAIRIVFHDWGLSITDGADHLAWWNAQCGKPWDRSGLIRQITRNPMKGFDTTRGVRVGASVMDELPTLSLGDDCPDSGQSAPTLADLQAALRIARAYRPTAKDTAANKLATKDKDLVGYVLDRDVANVKRHLPDVMGAILRHVPTNSIDEDIVALLWPDILDEQTARDALRDARAIVATQPPAVVVDDGDPDESPVTRAIKMVTSVAKLFRDPAGDPYACVGSTTMKIGSSAFHEFLAMLWFSRTDGALSDEARGGAINVLRAQAIYGGETHPVFVRVGELDGRTYLDLANGGRVVEIDGDGWRVLDRSPVFFTRPNGTLPLPVPVRDENVTIDRLFDFVIVPDEDRLRVLAFLVSSLRAKGPYWHLVAVGMAGATKTSCTRALRNLYDPNLADVQTIIGTGRDVMISARKRWFAAYDNLSELSAAQSDAMCCLATGGAFTQRELRTDDDEVILKASRPAIMTGVRDPVTAPDLMDRVIRIQYARLPDDRRKPESVVNEDYAAAHPAMLGALLDKVSKAIRELPAVKTAKHTWPRMADAAMFAVAALGPGVLAALAATAGDDHQVVLDSSTLVAPIRKLVRRGPWKGTATELLAVLTALAPDPLPRDWPAVPNQLSGRLSELIPALVHEGIHVTRGEGRERRIIAITPAQPANEAPPSP